MTVQEKEDEVVVKEHINLPNAITSLRILGTACLLFFEPFTSGFFVVYTLTGITDILDGWVARKTHTTSRFGAKLDSVADLIFYTVMLLKVFPALLKRLPTSLWIAIAVTIFLRLCAYVTAAVKYHRFASLHTILNKVTGGGVFLVPYFLLMPWTVPLCWCVCIVAMTASAEELLIHITRKEYNPKANSLFAKL